MIEQLIIACTPLITLGVGELIKIVKPKITGVFLLLLVGASSGIIAFVDSLAFQTDISSLFIFVYGLLSVVINQFFKQLKSGN